jgi:hypothetical protein
MTGSGIASIGIGWDVAYQQAPVEIKRNIASQVATVIERFREKGSAQLTQTSTFFVRDIPFLSRRRGLQNRRFHNLLPKC